MEFSRISPAPSAAACTAHSTASRPVPRRPPWVVISKPESVTAPSWQRRASSDSTSTWLPNRSAISAMSSGRATAAVLTPTLSAPCAEQPVDVVGAAHSPAHGQRDEDALGGAAHDVVGRRAVPGAGGDVEEGQLVGTLRVVDPGHLDRVTGVPQIDEVHALDHPAGVDVQARDDADGEGHAPAQRTASASISTSISGSMSAATCTIVEAGRTSPNTSPWARPTSSQREMSVT